MNYLKEFARNKKDAIVFTVNKNNLLVSPAYKKFDFLLLKEQLVIIGRLMFWMIMFSLSHLSY